MRKYTDVCFAFYSHIAADSMTHVSRDGLIAKLKELNIETLSVEHPDVSQNTPHCIVILIRSID